ncbi:alpha/beta fold hydrolase [Rhodopila sp.]|uniref:thioesterase domain-containing protein n=1 Tax=Rhodopila sp. TaxID=2480087 RepID=UPI003D0A87D7
MTGMQLDRMSGGAVAPPASLRQAGFEKDKKLTVFLLPGLSGDVGEFAALLSSPGGPVHFVPIHYRHWSSLQREARELDRLVADCVRQIESHAPGGEVLLLGYSFGGQIGWAVARAMEASGHRIGLLGLIDARACPKVPQGPASNAERLNRLIRGIRCGETADQLARFSAGALFRPQSNWARAAFGRLHASGLFPRMLNRIDFNIQMSFHLILLKEWMARMAACNERLRCPAALFRGSGWPLGEDADLGWSRYLATLRVVTIAGTHDDVLQPQNAEQIIAQVGAIISEGEGDLSVEGYTCM